MAHFGYLDGLHMTSDSFDAIFGGPPRQPEAALTQREMDIAASIQAVTEEVMLRMARHVHRETGQGNLCLAGGVALNCVANGRLLREGPFKRLWIQPAAGDAGGALGVALAIHHKVLGNPRETDGRDDVMRGAYLGPAHTDEEIARSILGDPRAPRMQSVMNLKIKHRETNPRYHALLSRFHELTGSPVLVNTSFNVRGEPMVCTPLDSWRCFMRTEMDALVIGSFVLLKEQQSPPLAEDEDWRTTFEPD